MMDSPTALAIAAAADPVGSAPAGHGREALARTGKIWFCVLTASRWWDCLVGF